MAAKWSGCRMERIFRVQTVAGGARIKLYIAREKKKSKKKETTTVQSARASRSKKKGDGV